MKTLLIYALIAAATLATQTARASHIRNASKVEVSPALTKESMNAVLVAGLGAYGRVLPGTTNETNAMGSTTFSLPMALTGGRRAELRAGLRVNQQGRNIANGASSNPEAYHLDVGVIASGLQGAAMRLNFQSRLTHVTPAHTRILVYEAPVATTTAIGRIVATVQQSEIKGQRGVWKTNATYVKFVSK